jgi:hypothetical protein
MEARRRDRLRKRERLLRKLERLKPGPRRDCLQKRLRIIEYFERRYRTDPAFRLLRLCRARMRNALKGNFKRGRSIDLIGCTSQELRDHFERHFNKGMSWGNQGRKWHVGHVIPCAAFDLSREDEQRRCFHFTNLRPEWAVPNLRNGARMKRPLTPSML